MQQNGGGGYSSAILLHQLVIELVQYPMNSSNQKAISVFKNYTITPLQLYL